LAPEAVIQDGYPYLGYRKRVKSELVQEMGKPPKGKIILFSWLIRLGF